MMCRQSVPWGAAPLRHDGPLRRLLHLRDDEVPEQLAEPHGESLFRMPDAEMPAQHRLFRHFDGRYSGEDRSGVPRAVHAANRERADPVADRPVACPPLPRPRTVYAPRKVGRVDSLRWFHAPQSLQATHTITTRRESAGTMGSTTRRARGWLGQTPFDKDSPCAVRAGDRLAFSSRSAVRSMFYMHTKQATDEAVVHPHPTSRGRPSRALPHTRWPAQLATRIPAALHCTMKLHCVETDTTLTDFVIEALREKLKRTGIRRV